MRRDARILAFTLVFERFFNESPFDEELWQQTAETDHAFAKSIFDAYNENRTSIEENISKLLVGYSIDRLHKVDLALLFIAAAELEYIKTPAAVVVNEVLEIAKLYSTPDSPKFLNGVLATLIKEHGYA